MYSYVPTFALKYGGGTPGAMRRKFFKGGGTRRVRPFDVDAELVYFCRRIRSEGLLRFGLIRHVPLFQTVILVVRTVWTFSPNCTTDSHDLTVWISFLLIGLSSIRSRFCFVCVVLLDTNERIRCRFQAGDENKVQGLGMLVTFRFLVSTTGVLGRSRTEAMYVCYPLYYLRCMITLLPTPRS